MLKRIKKVTLEEVLPLLWGTFYSGISYKNRVRVRHNKERVDLLGYSVCVNSLRLVTFKTKGIDCVCCGAKGSFFAIEQTVQNCQ